MVCAWPGAAVYFASKRIRSCTRTALQAKPLHSSGDGRGGFASKSHQTEMPSALETWQFLKRLTKMEIFFLFCR